MPDERTTLSEEEMQAIGRERSDQLQRIEDNVLALRAELLALSIGMNATGVPRSTHGSIGDLPVFWCRDFGAMLDEVTDDTDAILHTIAAAQAYPNGGLVDLGFARAKIAPRSQP